MDKNKNMGWLFPEINGATESENTETYREWLGIKITFGDIKFAKAFDTLEDQTKERVSAYVENGFSPTLAAKQLGLSELSFGKRLGEIKKKLGAKTLSELFPNYKKKSGGRGNNVDADVASATELMQLIEYQSYRCAISGIELTPGNAELDHKIPSSKGGSHTIENLQWLHKNINRAKGSMKQEEFINMCKRVTAWNR